MVRIAPRAWRGGAPHCQLLDGPRIETTCGGIGGKMGKHPLVGLRHMLDRCEQIVCARLIGYERECLCTERGHEPLVSSFRLGISGDARDNLERLG